MFSFRVTIACKMLVLGLLFVGCGKPFEMVETEKCAAQSKVQQAALAFPELVWKKEKVGVCWKNLRDEDRRFADLVQGEVTKYWDSQIELDFVGWEPCGADDTSGDIKIAIVDERSWSLPGDMAKFSTTSMSLNFTFKNFAPECGDNDNDLIYCIGYVAIHEFGHALGLDHEQNRPDTPKSCSDLVEVEKTLYGNRAYGEWDDKSIMNYCASVYEPSCTDIAAVQDLYGPESDTTGRLILGN